MSRPPVRRDELWSAELPKNRNKYYASPVLAGGKLYCAREDGVIFVADVSDDGFKQLSKNDMGERVFATPVPVRDSLIIRGEKHLFRIGTSDYDLSEYRRRPLRWPAFCRRWFFAGVAFLLRLRRPVLTTSNWLRRAS